MFTIAVVTPVLVQKNFTVHISQQEWLYREKIVAVIALLFWCRIRFCVVSQSMIL
jgi:hypothetical protein